MLTPIRTHKRSDEGIEPPTAGLRRPAYEAADPPWCASLFRQVPRDSAASRSSAPLLHRGRRGTLSADCSFAWKGAVATVEWLASAARRDQQQRRLRSSNGIMDRALLPEPVGWPTRFGGRVAVRLIRSSAAN